MTGWLLGWVIFSNECALIVSALYSFFVYINFTEIDMKSVSWGTPQYFSTGVEFIAIYVKR